MHDEFQSSRFFIEKNASHSIYLLESENGYFEAKAAAIFEALVFIINCLTCTFCHFFLDIQTGMADVQADEQTDHTQGLLIRPVEAERQRDRKIERQMCRQTEG